MANNNSASQTEESFNYAVEVIKSLPKNSNFQPSQEMMLRFYSLFKQANTGPCTGPRPSFWDPVGRAKYDAWQSLGGMCSLEAMELYVEELKKIVEVMPQTDAVGNFTRSLGRFYEIYVEKGPETTEKVITDKSPFRTPSPIRSSSVETPNEISPSTRIANGHIPSVGSEESSSSDSDAEYNEENVSEDEDQFADTIEVQPGHQESIVPYSTNSDRSQMPAVLSALDRVQADISSLSARLSAVERSIGELLVNSRRERYHRPLLETLFIILRSFRNPRNVRSLVIFVLPIIFGILVARRFLFLRRR